MCIYVNIRVPVCLLSCSFNSTGTLIFIFAVTGTGALATELLYLFGYLFVVELLYHFQGVIIFLHGVEDEGCDHDFYFPLKQEVVL